MEQIESNVVGSALGVTTSSVQLIEIPYGGTGAKITENVTLWCIGTTNYLGTIRRIFFKLPITYFTDGSNAVSIPEEGIPIPVASALFSHMEYSDLGGIMSTFEVEVNPQIGTGYLKVHITAPNTSTSWDFYAKAYIYKRVE